MQKTKSFDKVCSKFQLPWCTKSSSSLQCGRCHRAAQSAICLCYLEGHNFTVNMTHTDFVVLIPELNPITLALPPFLRLLFSLLPFRMKLRLGWVPKLCTSMSVLRVYIQGTTQKALEKIHPDVASIPKWPCEKKSRFDLTTQCLIQM